MNIIGIDPGKSGGIAVIADLVTGPHVDTCKLSGTERDIYDALEPYCQWVLQGVPCKAYIEKVHARPGQGVTSMFTFGRNYGFLRGLLIALGIPFEEVTPQKWQKAMGCMSKGDKNVTKQKAQQLFPDLKITHATADALLIAEYGRRTEKRGES